MRAEKCSSGCERAGPGLLTLAWWAVRGWLTWGRDRRELTRQGWRRQPDGWWEPPRG